jgi:hypothetical protein
MMHIFKTVFTATLCMVFTNTQAQDTIYSIAYTPSAYRHFDFNDRDTGNYFYITPSLGNIWQIGTPSKTVFNAAYSAPLALITDTLNTIPPANMSSFGFTLYTDDVTTISFWHRINCDSLSSGGVVEYSTDGGLSWNNIVASPYTLSNFYSPASLITSNTGQAGFTGTSGWTYSTISGYALNFVKFRFTFSTDMSVTTKDGWMIDDISVNTIGTGMQENGDEFSVEVFPNPAASQVNIRYHFTAGETTQFEIYNLVGEKVLGQELNGQHGIYSLNLGNLETGAYMYICRTGGKIVKSEKLVIVK